jgi:transposase
MGFSYPSRFREEVCARMLEGERVEALAAELDVAAGTLYRWKHQALIDAGRRPGVKSYEPDELSRARRRIKELEYELEAVKTASALFNGEEPPRPKASARSRKD